MTRALAVLLLLAAPGLADPSDDPAELARTWAEAEVRIPGSSGPRAGTAAALEDAAPVAGRAPTVVVYMHGCDGFGRIGERISNFLAEAGHVVVAPDDFAWARKPKSCEPARHRGGLHRAVLGWRQAELRHAVERVRAAPALPDARIAVMGHSEGAIAAATADLPPVAARVIEGWTCHAGWAEYRGIAAPEAEPVLALVGLADPWFDSPFLRGDCGRWMDANDVSEVYGPPGYLHRRHWLSFDGAVRSLILDFLAGAFSLASVLREVRPSE